ncbi:MAG TPA: peptidase MA family metallohydrolase [Anaerolineae bacterium]|nr:peptidase MA family metallohydrolase [Anaerolineae bacterium]
MTNLVNLASRFLPLASRFTHHVSRITYYALLATLLIYPLRGAPVSSALAQGSITIEDRGVALEFPERLTFSAHIESRAEIERVVLEYGVDKLTCGTVTAKAFPDFEPGAAAEVSWTWEMLQSGAEPPGAQVWYRWRVTDKAGNERVSDEQRAVWLDDQHAWRSISRDVLTLHWYAGTREFAEDLLNSAVDSLAQLSQTTGVAPEAPIDMYIYADTADMQDAILYEPGWTGGQAYSDHNILLIGISPDLLEWGKDTEAHELTHVLVGHLTFSCLSSMPNWLSEGIAVYGEGGLDPASQAALDRAIRADQLFSVRALSSGFSEHPDKADLSYSQSYSLVNYLVSEHGSDKLLALFRNLRDGMTIEAALNQVYGFGLDGLEDGWRASIGAQPHRAEGAVPTPTPMPTPVPTYRPISGAPLAPPVDSAQAATPLPVPTEQATTTAAAPPSPAPAATGLAQSEVNSPFAAPLLIGIVAVVLAIGAVILSVRSRKSL